ncbi:hypothetical protein Leryth_023205 [Lithospermum erythrorhizon]|nr:hypothetical protein Leryth_023205 [Lithospermum erythrorhizon]
MRLATRLESMRDTGLGTRRATRLGSRRDTRIGPGRATRLGPRWVVSMSGPMRLWSRRSQGAYEGADEVEAKGVEVEGARRFRTRRSQIG